MRGPPLAEIGESSTTLIITQMMDEDNRQILVGKSKWLCSSFNPKWKSALGGSRESRRRLDMEDAVVIVAAAVGWKFSDMEKISVSAEQSRARPRLPFALLMYGFFTSVKYWYSTGPVPVLCTRTTILPVRDGSVKIHVWSTDPNGSLKNLRQNRPWPMTMSEERDEHHALSPLHCTRTSTHLHPYHIAVNPEGMGLRPNRIRYACIRRCIAPPKFPI